MKAYPYMHKHPTSGQTTIEEGMDLRDYFAAKAMQGLLSSDVHAPIEEFAKNAYTMADAMIEQRNKKEVSSE